MNLSSLITDNVTEMLVKIIEFTQTRQKILVQNINNHHDPAFVPTDLAVEEFSDLLKDSIEEYMRSRRLVLRDSENVKFGAGGSFAVEPVVDKYAKELLEENRDEYLELQVNKLLENSLNLRVAAELLKQKEGTISIF